MIRGAPLALAALAACTVERQVLSDDTIFTVCEQVWASGESGDRCDLAEQCTQANPDNPTCCVDYAYCLDGELVIDATCDPECTSCTDDHGCTAGATICDGMLCQACDVSDPSGGGACGFECPEGWAFLTRNGCQTCECAPVSECDFLAPDPCTASEPDGAQCYRGQRFASGCAEDDAGCYANACSTPGCPEPVPLGCFTKCVEMTECGQCATTHCECDQTTLSWVCDEICLDGYSLALTCSF